MKLINLSFLFFLTLQVHGQHHQDSVWANRLYEKAIDDLKESEFDSAKQNLQAVLSFFKKSSNFIKLAESYNLLSKANFQQSHYPEAKQWSKKALELSLQNRRTPVIELLRAYYNLGNFFLHSTVLDSAIYCYQKALPLCDKIPPKFEFDKAKFYHSLAVYYYYKKDYEMDLHYLFKAASIYQKINNRIEIVSLYNSIANTYIFMGKDSYALDYLTKATEVFQDARNINSGTVMILVNTYYQLGELYTNRGDYGRALMYFEKSNSFKQGVSPTFQIMNNRSLGVIYSELGKYDLGIFHFNKALAIASTIFGERHPAIASIYSRLAILNKNRGLLQEGLVNYQRSLISDSKMFHDLRYSSQPKADDILDVDEATFALLNKANALSILYGQHLDIEDLKYCLQAYQLADTLVTKARHERIARSDKMVFGNEYSEICEKAISTCLKLFEITHDLHYYEEAFLYSEKNKSALLAEVASDAFAKNSGLVPKDLVTYENTIYLKISDAESNLKQVQKSHDSLKISENENLIFKLKLEADSLMHVYSKDFPLYYSTRNTDVLISVPVLQSALPPHLLVAEYFEGAENVYVFFVSKEQYLVSVIPNDSTYKELTNDFKKLFSTNQASIIQSERGYNDFIRNSHDIFVLLLGNAWKGMQDIKRFNTITIIPDGQLSYLPFDILLSRLPGEPDGNYSTLDYLIQDHTITYGYSATLNFKKYGIKKIRASRSLISFAPNYDGKKPDSLQALALGQFRDNLTALKWNQEEARKIVEMIGGDSYVAGAATERSFKLEAQKYDIIHLATHSFVDDNEPMNSKFVFVQDNDSTEDGYLHAFELFSMRLNASMAVLSACNTGDGQYAKGEGIMSLSRAFSYAGVPSVVMSQWRVDDEATQVIMELFYKNIKKGLNKGQAMRDAKLMYLKQADPTKTHPFFWAAFVTIGNDEPIQMSSASIPKITMVTILVVLFLLAAVCFWRLGNSS